MQKYVKGNKLDNSQMKQRFSLKKVKHGLASVLVGLLFLGFSSSTVLSDELTNTGTTTKSDLLDSVSLGSVTDSNLVTTDQLIDLDQTLEAKNTGHVKEVTSPSLVEPQAVDSTNGMVSGSEKTTEIASSSSMTSANDANVGVMTKEEAATMFKDISSFTSKRNETDFNINMGNRDDKEVGFGVKEVELKPGQEYTISFKDGDVIKTPDLYLYQPYPGIFEKADGAVEGTNSNLTAVTYDRNNRTIKALTLDNDASVEVWTHYNDRLYRLHIKVLGKNYVDYIEKVKETETKANEIIADFNKLVLPTEYDKVKVAHDWIIKNVEYNYEALTVRWSWTDSHAYGPLVLNTAICGGYTLGLKYLLHKLGIESYYITGYVSPSAIAQNGYHAWNLVKLDGKYYHIDSTWDDQTKDGIKGIWKSYDYFLLSDNSIQEKKHLSDNQVHSADDGDYILKYIKNINNFASTLGDVATAINNQYQKNEYLPGTLSISIPKIATEENTVEEMKKLIQDNFLTKDGKRLTGVIERREFSTVYSYLFHYTDENKAVDPVLIKMGEAKEGQEEAIKAYENFYNPTVTSESGVDSQSEKNTSKEAETPSEVTVQPETPETKETAQEPETEVHPPSQEAETPSEVTVQPETPESKETAQEPETEVHPPSQEAETPSEVTVQPGTPETKETVQESETEVQSPAQQAEVSSQGVITQLKYKSPSQSLHIGNLGQGSESYEQAPVMTELPKGEFAVGTSNENKSLIKEENNRKPVATQQQSTKVANKQVSQQKSSPSRVENKGLFVVGAVLLLMASLAAVTLGRKKRS